MRNRRIGFFLATWALWLPLAAGQERPQPGAGPSQPFEAKEAYALDLFNGASNLRVEEREKPGPTGRPALSIQAECPRDNSGIDVVWSFPPAVLDGKTFSLNVLTPNGPVPYVRARFLDAAGRQVSTSTYFTVEAPDWKPLSFGVLDKSGAATIEPGKPAPGQSVASIRLQFCGQKGKPIHAVISDFAAAGESRTKRVASPAAGAPILSKDGIELWLDAERGYALSAARVGDIRFERPVGGAYPEFVFLDANGARLNGAAGDPGFEVKSEPRGPESLAVRYSRGGTTVELLYSVSGGALRCDVTVVEEGSLKLVSVGADRMLGTELGRADYGILPTGALWPRLDGRPPQSFRRMGNADNMVPNFGAARIGGSIVFYKPLTASQEMNVALAAADPGEMLWFGGKLFFRPSRVKNPATKACHAALGWRIETAGDENRDGEVDWVDCGIAYRNRYIRKNQALDPSVRDSQKFYHGMPGDTYEQLARVIEKMDYCPTLWWVKGAMTTLVSPGSECHPYTIEPDPKRGDRAAFQERYAASGARVGIYYGHDYLDNFNKDWPDELIKRDENGGPSQYYLHQGHRLTYKDNVRGLATGLLKKHYDEILRVCGFARGSPVMLDTFTAYGREGYHPDFPATPQVETDAKRELARWFKQERGMSIAGESVIEGTEDMLDFGAVFYDFERLQESRFWTRESWVPLPSVIYHGRTYTGLSAYEFRNPHVNWAASLVTGCSMWQWTGGHYPDMYDFGARMFFNQNIIWAQNADADIVDIDRTGTEYRIRFANGNTLWADPGREAWRMEAGGVLYDGFTPFSTRGVMAILLQGDFDLTLPVKDMLEILPSQPYREKLDVTIEPAADGRIRVRGNFSRIPWKLKWVHRPEGAKKEVVELRDASPVLLLRRRP
jgi:hypothetical protein